MNTPFKQRGIIDPGTATLLAAGGSFLGGLFGNKAKRREAARNRAFQERMSSTAYQRQTKDLELAGLNRILGYTKGGPASTPGGAMAQQADIVTPAVSTALQTKRLHQELKNMLAVETKDTRLGALHSQQYNVGEQQEQKLLTEIKLLEAQIPGANAEAALWAKLNEGGGTAKGMLRFLPILKLLRGQ